MFDFKNLIGLLKSDDESLKARKELVIQGENSFCIEFNSMVINDVHGQIMQDNKKNFNLLLDSYENTGYSNLIGRHMPFYHGFDSEDEAIKAMFKVLKSMPNEMIENLKFVGKDLNHFCQQNDLTGIFKMLRDKGVTLKDNDPFSQSYQKYQKEKDLIMYHYAERNTQNQNDKHILSADLFCHMNMNPIRGYISGVLTPFADQHNGQSALDDTDIPKNG